MGRKILIQLIKTLSGSFMTNLGISASGALPQQEITREIHMVVAARDNKADKRCTYTYNNYKINIVKYQPITDCLLFSLSRDLKTSFYRASYVLHGICHRHVSVSVCLSVIDRCSIKKAKRRMTQTTSHDSPGTVVF